MKKKKKTYVEVNVAALLGLVEEAREIVASADRFGNQHLVHDDMVALFRKHNIPALKAEYVYGDIDCDDYVKFSGKQIKVVYTK